jgi:uncharacterized Zn finger protein (UPF0148 family)
MARPEIEFTHGQRVRVSGFTGPRGVMMHCKRTYWKVKLQSGEWVYPNDVVADTDGPFEYRCQECGIPFRTKSQGEPFCPVHDNREAMVQSYERSRNISDIHRYHLESKRANFRVAPDAGLNQAAAGTVREAVPTPENATTAAVRKIAQQIDDTEYPF